MGLVKAHAGVGLCVLRQNTITMRKVYYWLKKNNLKLTKLIFRLLSIFLAGMNIYWWLQVNGSVTYKLKAFFGVILGFVLLYIFFSDAWDSDDVPESIRKYFRSE